MCKCIGKNIVYTEFGNILGFRDLLGVLGSIPVNKGVLLNSFYSRMY